MKWFSIPSSVDHVLSDMTRLSWVALYGMAHSFIQLDKVVIHVISVISFCDCAIHSVCPLMNQDKRFVEASGWQTDCGGNWVLF